MFAFQISENTKDVKVGTLIALMVPEGEDWNSVELPGDAGPAAATTSETAQTTTTGTGKCML